MTSVNSQSSETTGYHIFLEPEGEVRSEIQRIINTLSKENNSPSFPSHITLLARIPASSDEEVIEKTQKLAKQIKPFSVALDENRI